MKIVGVSVVTLMEGLSTKLTLWFLETTNEGKSRSCDFGHQAQTLLAESQTQTSKCRNKNVPSKFCYLAFHFSWALEMKIYYLGTSRKYSAELF